MAKRKNKKRKKHAPVKGSTVQHGASTSTADSTLVRPRFTVAMATYNRAHWVADSIHSVLSQSFVDFEYVIVDDGSTDDTAAVINAIQDARIKYIQKPVNEGRPATRNRVVAESCGEYILWMADDDRLAPGILARYDLALRNDPSIDVIYGNLAVFSESADAVESTYEPTDWVSNPRGFVGAKLSGSMLPDPGTATRLEIVQSLDYVYDLEFLRAQDYELWTRIAHTIKIHKVNEAVYFYRQHEESASFGDFVDTTYESKIIRAHRARHSGEVLAPDLDWRHQGIAHACLNLRIATALNQYRDGINAFRFCADIPNWHNEPMVLKEAITALCIQGQTQRALELIDRALANLPKLHEEFEQFRINVLQLVVFKTKTDGQLTLLDEAGLVESIRMVHEHWGWTYDLARVFGQMKQNTGQLNAAALAYAYAARLNLDDTACVSALEQLNAQVSLAPGKIDVASMRRRISESFVQLGGDLAPESSSQDTVLTILDLHHQSPDVLLAMLARQDVERFEIVGFYGPDMGFPSVQSIERVGDFRAQLKSVLNAVSGDWFVFAEPSMYLYQNWVSSILSDSHTADESI
jgi:glycosyltransferase involved in cell wall biosynthesis